MKVQPKAKDSKEYLKYVEPLKAAYKEYYQTLDAEIERHKKAKPRANK